MIQTEKETGESNANVGKLVTGTGVMGVRVLKTEYRADLGSRHTREGAVVGNPPSEAPGRVVGRDDRWRAESWVLLLRPELAAFLTSLPSHHLLPLSHHCLWSGLPSGCTIHPFFTLSKRWSGGLNLGSLTSEPATSLHCP